MHRPGIPALKIEARRLYLIMNAAAALCYTLVFTASNLFVITVAKLEPLQLVLVGTVLELSAFIFEIPTGVVADLFSRRLSVIIGFALVGVGFIVYGGWPYFATILLAQVLWGLGYTFTSGAAEAWISDEIGEERAAVTYLSAARLDQIASLVAIPLTVLLAARGGLSLPMLIGGGGFILLSVFLWAAMSEDGFTPTPAADRTTWQQMRQTLRQGLGMVRARPALLGILGIGLFYGLYSEAYDRLSTALLLDRFTFPTWLDLPLIGWFGAISAVGMLFSLVATTLVERLGLTRPRQLALAMGSGTALLVAALAGFAVSRSLVFSIALVWTIGLLRRVNAPLYTAWVNHRLDSQVRATVISMSSQVDALGQIAGGPLLGLAAQALGLQAGLLGSALLLSPALLLFALQLRGEAR